MENKKINENITENDISFKELFLALYRKKIIIISITFIIALLAGLISIFAITPVYNSEFNIVINMPEKYSTKYGEYTMPITSNQQYIDLITSNDILIKTIKDMGYDDNKMTPEKLRRSISIVASGASLPDSKQNNFNISVSADNAQEAQKLAQVLYKNYIEYIDVMIDKMIVNSYCDYYTVNINILNDTLEINKNQLEENEKLLKTTPQTINQKEAMDEILKNNNKNDYIVLEDIINSNYTELEKNIILNKQVIAETELSIKLNNRNLKELNSEKEAILAAEKGGKLEHSIAGVVDSNIYLSSQPVAPNHKASPSTLKNTIIGTLLGLLMGISYALLKEFWSKIIN